MEIRKDVTTIWCNVNIKIYIVEDSGKLTPILSKSIFRVWGKFSKIGK